MDAPLLADASQPQTVASPLAPMQDDLGPLLVHGLDGRLPTLLARFDENMLPKVAGFVIEALAEVGWAGVKPADVKVVNSSGRGGGATFTASCQYASPPCVVLHTRDRGHAKDWDAISAGRKEAAQLVFARYGLAPCRIAQGSDWFVETWAGTTLGTPFALKDATPEEIGTLLAKVHALPTEWFDETRERLMQSYPELRQVPRSSGLWKAGVRHADSFQGLTTEQWDLWKKMMPEMTSPYATKAVTCHGDLHPQNLVRGTDGKIRLIDLEATCVSNAATDFAWAFLLYLDKPGDRRRMAEAYLQASGVQATGAEMDEFLFDCQVRHAMMVLAMDMMQFKKDPYHDFESKSLLALVEMARTSEKLRTTIIQRGLTKMNPCRDLACKAMKWACVAVALVPLVVAPIAAVGAVIYVASQ